MARIALVAALLPACVVAAGLPGAAAAGAPVGPVNPVDLPDGTRQGFLVVAELDAELYANGIEGGIAVGGDLATGGTYQVGFATGMQGYLAPGDTTPTLLLVGGKIDWPGSTGGAMLNVGQGGYAKVGDDTATVVRTTDDGGVSQHTRILPAATGTLDFDATPRIGLGITQPPASVLADPQYDFAGVFSIYRERSALLAGCPNSLVLSTAGGDPIATPVAPGTNATVLLTANRTNVVNLSATDLNNIDTLSFPQAPNQSTPLLINVDTTAVGGVLDWTVPTFSGLALVDAQFILVNFPDASRLSQTAGGTLEGTIFAPSADFVDRNPNNNEGNIIVRSFVHGERILTPPSGDVRDAPFDAEISCEPGPATPGPSQFAPPTAPGTPGAPAPIGSAAPTAPDPGGSAVVAPGRAAAPGFPAAADLPATGLRVALAAVVGTTLLTLGVLVLVELAFHRRRRAHHHRDGR